MTEPPSASSSSEASAGGIDLSLPQTGRALTYIFKELHAIRKLNFLDGRLSASPERFRKRMLMWPFMYTRFQRENLRAEWKVRDRRMKELLFYRDNLSLASSSLPAFDDVQLTSERIASLKLVRQGQEVDSQNVFNTLSSSPSYREALRDRVRKLREARRTKRQHAHSAPSP